MSEHLPECQRWFTDMPEPDECAACEMFRACEQRVTAETLSRLLDAGNVMAQEFYAAGVQAARDAVAALPHDTYCVTRDENYQRPCNCLRDDALAAIDALREEHK